MIFMVHDEAPLLQGYAGAAVYTLPGGLMRRYRVPPGWSAADFAREPFVLVDAPEDPIPDGRVATGWSLIDGRAVPTLAPDLPTATGAQATAALNGVVNRMILRERREKSMQALEEIIEELAQLGVRPTTAQLNVARTAIPARLEAAGIIPPAS